MPPQSALPSLKIVGSEPLPQSGPLGPGQLMAPTAARTTGVRSMAVDVDGKHVLLPFDGNISDPAAVQQAISRYHTTGEHLGIFDSLSAAQSAAKQAVAPSQPPPQLPAQPPSDVSVNIVGSEPLGIAGSEPLPPSINLGDGGQPLPMAAPGPITQGVQGVGNAASGLYEHQGLHPLQIGQQALDLVGPAGLAVHDLVTGQSSPQQFVDTATSGARGLIGQPTIDPQRISQALQAVQQGRPVHAAVLAGGSLRGAEGGILAAQGQPWVEGVQAWQQGNHLAALRHFFDWAIPVVGPMMDQSANRMDQGEVARGVGNLIGDMINLVLMAKPLAPDIQANLGGLSDNPLGKTAPGNVLPPAQVSMRPQFSEANADFKTGTATPNGPLPQAPPGQQIVPGGQRMPEVGLTEQQAAINAIPTPTPQQRRDIGAYADQHQIPISLGARTGNWGARAGEQLNEHASLGAQVVGDTMRTRFANRMAVEGQRLANATDPAHSSVSGLLNDWQQATTRGYDHFRSVARAATQRVRVMVTGQWQGRGAPVAVPQIQTIELPVDITAAKASLADVYARLQRQWIKPLIPAKERGLNALEQIVHGPDIVSAEDLDATLSNLKAVARAHGGPSKLAVGQLEQALQDALQKAAPDAKAALEEGRAAKRAEMAVRDFIGQSRNEPYGIFNRITQEASRGQRLSELARLKADAPAALPAIGRWLLQDMLNKAFHEPGTFDHAAALYRDWEKIPPEFKQALYGKTGSDISLFFRTAVEMSRDVNPSGSGYMVGFEYKLGKVVALVVHNPVGALIEVPLVEAAQGGLARLLYVPGVARTLAKLMRTPQGNAASMGEVAEVLNAARAAGIVTGSGHVAPALPAAAQAPPPQPPTQAAGPGAGGPPPPGLPPGDSPQNAAAPWYARQGVDPRMADVVRSVAGPNAFDRNDVPSQVGGVSSLDNRGRVAQAMLQEGAGAQATAQAVGNARTGDVDLGGPPQLTPEPGRPVPQQPMPPPDLSQDSPQNARAAWYARQQVDPSLQQTVRAVAGPNAFDKNDVVTRHANGAVMHDNRGRVAQAMLKEGKNPYEISVALKNAKINDIDLGPAQRVGPYTVREVKR